jgi:hypothetical protein
LELDARAFWRTINAQPDCREKRIRFRVEDLNRLAGADGPLDVERRRFAKCDIKAELVCQRRLDDLFLDLAIERDRELLAGVVLTDVDQRILLGELCERDAEPRAVFGLIGDDDGLQCRWGEMVV